MQRTKPTQGEDRKMKNIISKFEGCEKSDVVFLRREYGGMSNMSYIYKSNKKMYTLHVTSQLGLRFIDRKKEYEIVKTLEGKGIMQNVVFFNPKNPKFRVFEYIDGDVLDRTRPYMEVKGVAKTLHKLHSLPLFPFDYKPFDYLVINEASVKRDLSMDFYKVKDILYEYKKELEERPLCPCHCDSQPANMVKRYSDGKVILLDFEYAGNNDYLYDIAGFGNDNFVNALALLREYNPKYTKNDLRYLFLWKIFICLQWYLVALKKQEMRVGRILHYNFDDVADYFLSQALPLAEAVKNDTIVEYMKEQLKTLE